MKRLAPHDVALVVGKRGTGKSFFAKGLAAAELAAGARVLAFDPHDEYSQAGRKTAQVNLGPLREHCTTDELLADPSRLDDKRLSLAVVPGPELAADLVDIVALVNASGRMTFILDEVGEYSDAAADVLKSLATQSRHYEVPCVFVAQRLTQIPLTARSQASVVHTGLQSAPADLAALEDLTGSPDFAAEVSRLPRRRFITWRDN